MRVKLNLAGSGPPSLQRWPLLAPVFAILAGLMLARTDVVDIDTAVALLPVAVVALLVFRQRLPALLLVVAVLWGVADLWWDAHQLDVDASWLGRDVEISADVEHIDRFSGYRRFRLNHIRRSDGARLPGKALLYQHQASQQPAGEGDGHILAGQRIRLQARWRLPRNFHNPGSFDYRGWCFDHHIVLIGGMKGKPTIVRAATPWLQQQRMKVRAVIHRVDKPYKTYTTYKAYKVNSLDHDAAAILQALLLGERSQISPRVNALFSATGTAHLLAISGMHVGMAAGWALMLIWLILTRREAWMVRLPVRNISIICGFLAAAAYAALADWPLPAVRAAMMLAAAALAWSLSARSEPINTLLAALGLILLFDPTAIASLSLWLSFVATAALLLWAGRREPLLATGQRSESTRLSQKVTRAVRTMLWVSLLATLATLPLIVATFGRIPTYSLPANMVMAPLYALVVMPLGLLAELSALLGLDHVALLLMHLAAAGVTVGLQMLQWIFALPAGRLWASYPALWMQAGYLFGMAGAALLWWCGHRGGAMLSALLVAAAWLALVLHETDIQQPQWIAWDVGQGAASTLLLPGNRVLAVDAPGRQGSRFNGGTSEAAGLRRIGITHLDVLAISHAQSDHLGGALSLMQHMNSVGELWLPDTPATRMDGRVKALVRYAQLHGATTRWLTQGDRVAMPRDAGTNISVLWPPRGLNPANANNASLVLAARLSNGIRMLWPGDIEAEAEKQLLAAGVGKTDVMLMPHHGSNTSSTPALVEALHPQIAIAQTGFANRYHFPKPAVLQRYGRIGATVCNTAAGACMVRWPQGGGVARVENWRSHQRLRRELASSLIKKSCTEGFNPG